MTSSDRLPIGRKSSSRSRSFKPPRRRIRLVRVVCLGLATTLIAACWRYAPPTGENDRPLDDDGLIDTRSDADPDKPVGFSLPWNGEDTLGKACSSDVTCQDSNNCTDDLCVNGSCTNPARSGGCSDGNACTVNDTCRNKVCKSGPPKNCDDNNPCTGDSCSAGICRNRLTPGACDDGVFCNGSESCNDGECSSGNPPCPAALCHEDTDSCDDCTQPSQCDDGLFCNGTETCVSGLCQSSDPCPGQFCDEAARMCIDCLEGAACDDGDECTENDTCQNGICGGTPVDCSTTHLCVLSLPCDPVLGCQYADVCDDGDICTDDNCDSSTGKCEFEPIWPAFHPSILCSSRGCGGFINAPLPVPSNNDDDNNNNISDRDEDGQVSGENDLVAITLSIPQCPESYHPPYWRLVGWAFYYREHDKAGRLYNNVGHCFPVPGTIYVEGVNTTEWCGAPFVIWSHYPQQDPFDIEISCVWESNPVIVYKVASVNWEAVDGNLALETCPNNGGKQIFPGKIGPNDSTPNVRKQVDLVATVNPPIPGVEVYFKLWDVDDPFDQIHGPLGADDVPNVAEIDNNQAGPDNRPLPGEAPMTHTATTGPDGTATWTITVSMQPGNNYRAAASALSDVFGPDPQVTQATADLLGVKSDNQGNLVANGEDWGYKVPVVWSEMLTVWRKLHVETDTMVRPTFAQNTFPMNWSKPRTGSPSTVVLFEVADPPETALRTPDDQFYNGYVQLEDAAGNVIVTARIQQYWTDEDQNDEDTDLFDKVRINLTDCGNGQSGLACLGGVTSGLAILSDDDLSDQATFSAKTWGCNDTFSGPVASLAPPDLSKMVERYNLAYIEPVHDQSASAVQGLVTFLQNVDFDVFDGKILWDQALAARNLPVSTAAFWTVMVVSAWQAEQPQDADPDTEDQVGIGVTKGINTHPVNFLGYTSTTSNIEGAPGANYTGICVVFKAVFGEFSFAEYEPYTVVHEVGHTFGLDHRAGGAMCKKGDCQREPFQAVELKELRNYVQP